MYVVDVMSRPKDTLNKLEVGETITVDTHNQTFTVTDVMFGGEMVEVEGPRGGEKTLVQNVNSGNVRIDSQIVSEINV